MKNSQSFRQILFGLFIVQFLCFIAPQTVFCQTETLDIVQYTPPKGWTKTPKEGAITYSDINKATESFCIITVYASTPSAGTPQKDFANEWNELVVKPFKAGDAPNTETQSEDGWDGTIGASKFKTDGVESSVMLTVFSGFGRTTSVLVILTSDSYLTDIDAFLGSIKLDKTVAMAVKTAPIVSTDVSDSSKVFSGKWGNYSSGMNPWDSSSLVLNSGYYKTQYTFNPNGSYSFKGEKWLGYIKQNEYWMTDESGDFTANGDTLTIIPKKSVTTLKNREGKVLSAQNNALEKTTYKWTLHYFSGSEVTDLILQTNTETRRDGAFGSNNQFPKSYFYDQKYVPEWKFD